MRLLPLIGAVLVGAGAGAGTVALVDQTALVSDTSPTQQLTPQQATPPGTAPANPALANANPALANANPALANADPALSNPEPSNTASSATSPPAETVRPFERIAFAAPVTDPAGLSMMVLPPEKVKGGVRFTISLVNTSEGPITINTGSLGPHEPRFNDASVPMSMSSVRKKLVPGEGYTYQCVFKLPTMDVGQVEFSVGSMNVAGQAAGD